MIDGLRFSILVVDDDEDDRFFMDKAFQAIGYEPEVKKFITGEDLIHYLEKINSSVYPSLIVLDNTLPKLNASDILTKLKSNPHYEHIPVVIYSTFIPAQKKQQLISRGAYACLEKGNSMRELVKVAKDLKELAEANIKE